MEYFLVMSPSLTLAKQILKLELISAKSEELNPAISFVTPDKLVKRPNLNPMISFIFS